MHSSLTISPIISMPGAALSLRPRRRSRRPESLASPLPTTSRILTTSTRLSASWRLPTTTAWACTVSSTTPATPASRRHRQRLDLPHPSWTTHASWRLQRWQRRRPWWRNILNRREMSQKMRMALTAVWGRSLWHRVRRTPRSSHPFGRKKRRPWWQKTITATATIVAWWNFGVWGQWIWPRKRTIVLH